MTDKIRQIQAAIVAALEKGEDATELSRQLAQERARLAAQVDIEELKAIADRRRALRDRAEDVKAKVAKQGAAVDKFLAARDKVVRQLEPCLEPLGELAEMVRPPWERNPGEVFLFPDPGQFQGALRDIPAELLPEGFECQTLVMAQPGERSLGKVHDALLYLQFCIGILRSLKKGSMSPHARPADGSLLLDAENTDEGSRELPLTCRVCEHPDSQRIDKALREGVRSLRDIEEEFAVSRSTLSRHKRKCLEVEAVPTTE